MNDETPRCSGSPLDGVHDPADMELESVDYLEMQHSNLEVWRCPVCQRAEEWSEDV